MDKALTARKPKTEAKPWDRRLWGVRFTSKSRLSDPMLIGARWLNGSFARRYEGEPSRTLVFDTRKQARECCKTMAEKYRGTCPGWKFRPVSVSEVVKEAVAK